MHYYYVWIRDLLLVLTSTIRYQIKRRDIRGIISLCLHNNLLHVIRYVCEIGKYLEYRTVPFGSYGRDLLHLGIHDYYLSIVITIMIEMVQSLVRPILWILVSTQHNNYYTNCILLILQSLSRILLDKYHRVAYSCVLVIYLKGVSPPLSTVYRTPRLVTTSRGNS